VHIFTIALFDAPAPVLDAIRKMLGALRLLINAEHVVFGETHEGGQADEDQAG